MSVTISEGVKKIGKYAFSGCSALTEIILPESVADIDDCAFWKCSGLKNIVIPENVKNKDASDILSYYSYLETLSETDTPVDITEYISN